MLKNKVILVTALLLSIICFSNVPLRAQVDYRWISAGSLHNWFCNYGSEVEEGLVLKQQYGMVWPATYTNQHSQAWKALWIGYNNGTPKVVHVGPRVSGQNEFYPMKFKLTYKRELPVMKAGSDLSALSTVQDPDQVDPSIPFDQMIENVLNTKIGITVTRKIGGFAASGHDNYIIHDYTFKNTGFVDGTNVKKSNETLNNLYFFILARISSNDQARYAINNATGWGMQTTLDAVGDGNSFFSQTGVTEPKVRAQYAWHGKYPGFTTYDNVGGMIVDGNFTGGIKYDTTGRLGAPQFVGLLTVSASKGPGSSEYSVDDTEQPRTTVTLDSDSPLMSANSVDNSAKCSLEYALMTSGHDVRHLSKISEPASYFNDAKPAKDPSTGTNGGYQMGNGYGPYTLAPGDSVRIVWAEVVDGLDYKTCIEVGKKYKAAISAGKAGDATAIQTKNTSFFQGRGMLFKTMERAVDNFKSQYANSTNSFVAPLATVTAKGKEGGVSLEWSYYQGEAPDSVRIFRTYNYHYNELEYKFVKSVPASQTKYIDTQATPGYKSYYYFICKKNNGNQSIRTSNQLVLPVIAKPRIMWTEDELRQINNLEKVRAVPNPFVNLGGSDKVQNGVGLPNRIYFRGIPKHCKIDIYTEVGEHIFTTWQIPDAENDASWDCQTKNNQVVVSGIYLANVKNLDNGKSKIIKIVVIR